jgi:DNA-binding LacI/PurR family transcriptional regulator
LIGRRRRRIVFLGDPAAPEIQLRHKGYLQSLRRASLPADPALLVRAHLTPDTAYESMRALIEAGTRFDAVFAASDVIAISAIRAITGSGRAVPRDVAVVGYDDISLAAHTNPTLTTVRQDLQRGAHMMVDLMFRRLDGEDTPSATMPAELVVRESSGGASAS